MQEMEERMRATLLMFVNILYAVVYGLILVQTFDQVVIPATKPLLEKANNLLLIIGVFYFLTWDWLHAHRLILRNPYASYRRFYMEVFIAFLSYGAALNAIRMQVFFLVYIFLGLLMGAVWARATLKEYPNSKDRLELRVIQLHQTIYTLGGLIVFFYWHFYVRKTITLYESAWFILAGYFFVLTYDIFVERQAGIIGGPGAPFIRKKVVDRIRRHLL